MTMFCSTKKKEYFESESFLRLDVATQNKILKEEVDKLLKLTRYGLVWEDHPEQISLNDLYVTFVKNEALSLPMIPNKPMNYLIEGDNYYALQALQKTHKGKVDVIYIDPPYNTGNEFVYNDKLVDKEDMFSHSKWLSFMSKRLKLAHELLTDDGVVFVSIDDHEQAQLKLLMDKVFGEKNFIANIIVETNPKGRKNSKHISNTHEYLLVYAKQKEMTEFMEVVPKNNDSRKVYTDSKGKYKQSKRMLVGSSSNREVKEREDKKNYDVVYNKKTDEIRLLTKPYQQVELEEDEVLYKNEKGGVQIEATYTMNTFLNKHRNNDLIFKKDTIYEKDRTLFSRSKSIWNKANLNQLDLLNETANKHLKEMLHDTGYTFDFPKHLNLLKLILKHVNKNAVILDFFAGSGTTGHAVMELNEEDGGHRQFILCTNNEVSQDKECEYLTEQGYIEEPKKRLYNKFKKEQAEQYEAFLNSEAYESLGIARSVTRERLKRVIEGYITSEGKEVEGLPNNLAYLQIKEIQEEEIIDEPQQVMEDLKQMHELNYPSNRYETLYVDDYKNIHSITDLQPKTERPLLIVMNTNDNQLISHVTEIAKREFPQLQKIIRIMDYL